MEIEEMQALWSEMSDQLEQQKKLTNEIIMNMTQEKYSNKFKTISRFESLGAIVCFAAALYILFNFSKLEGVIEIGCGIFTLAFLILMPVLVLKSLWSLKNFNIGQKTTKETLVTYTAKKKQLLYLQQLGIYACFVLMFTIMPVTSKIMSNKDFFSIPRDIGFYLGIGLALIFLFFYARWGYGCYKKITNSAESLLKGME